MTENPAVMLYKTENPDSHRPTSPKLRQLYKTANPASYIKVIHEIEFNHTSIMIIQSMSLDNFT